MTNKKEVNTEEKEYLNKKYNLKNDVIFKAFFSRKGNEEFLIDFLNALLNIQIEEIEIQQRSRLRKIRSKRKRRKIRLTSKTK